MSNRRKASRPTVERASVHLGLTADQKEKILRDWRCGHCDADPPVAVRPCPDCPPTGIYFPHDPGCPVRAGTVSGMPNIRRALAL